MMWSRGEFGLEGIFRIIWFNFYIFLRGVGLVLGGGIRVLDFRVVGVFIWRS